MLSGIGQAQDPSTNKTVSWSPWKPLHYFKLRVTMPKLGCKWKSPIFGSICSRKLPISALIVAKMTKPRFINTTKWLKDIPSFNGFTGYLAMSFSLSSAHCATLLSGIQFSRHSTLQCSLFSLSLYVCGSCK